MWVYTTKRCIVYFYIPGLQINCITQYRFWYLILFLHLAFYFSHLNVAVCSCSSCIVLAVSHSIVWIFCRFLIILPLVDPLVVSRFLLRMLLEYSDPCLLVQMCKSFSRLSGSSCFGVVSDLILTLLAVLLSPPGGWLLRFQALCQLGWVNGRHWAVEIGGHKGERNQAFLFSLCLEQCFWKGRRLSVLLTWASGQATVVLASVRQLWPTCFYIMSLPPSVPLAWESSNFSYKDGNYFRFCKPYVSVGTTQFCERVWLCSNKTSFPKTETTHI